MILIKRPMTLYLRIYTRRNLVVIVAGLWLVALATMIVPPLFGIGGFGYDERHHTCTDLDTHPKAKTFDRIQIIVAYPVPLIVIVTCSFLMTKNPFFLPSVAVMKSSAVLAAILVSLQLAACGAIGGYPGEFLNLPGLF